MRLTVGRTLTALLIPAGLSRRTRFALLLGNLGISTAAVLLALGAVRRTFLLLPGFPSLLLMVGTRLAGVAFAFTGLLLGLRSGSGSALSLALMSGRLGSSLRSRSFFLRLFGRSMLARKLFQNKISASEVAVFVQIILKIDNRRFLARFAVILTEKSSEAQLIIAPVTHYIIVAFEHFAVTVPENFLIPTVPVFGNQLVRSASDMNHVPIPPLYPGVGYGADVCEADRTCSCAWYELRTSGPDSTCLNPRFIPSSFNRANCSGV